MSESYYVLRTRPYSRSQGVQRLHQWDFGICSFPPSSALSCGPAHDREHRWSTNLLSTLHSPPRKTIPSNPSCHSRLLILINWMTALRNLCIMVTEDVSMYTIAQIVTIARHRAPYCAVRARVSNSFAVVQLVSETHGTIEFLSSIGPINKTKTTIASLCRPDD